MGLFAQGWTNRVQSQVNNTTTGVAQTDFVTYISHKGGGNTFANIFPPLSFYTGINRAATDGRDIRLSSDSDGNTVKPLDLIAYNPNVDSGTTTSTTANKLVQTGQDFLTTVKVGDRVFNTTDNTAALVTAIDSNTTLSLNADIMASGEVFLIVRFYAVTNNDIPTTTAFFYLWGGNSNATLPAVTDPEGRNAVYEPVANPYLATWHLNEPDATNAVDSTGNGWTGTSAGTNKPESIDGIFYQGQFFSGNNGAPAVEDRFNISGSTTAPWEMGGAYPYSPFTVSTWARASGETGVNQRIFGKRGTYGYDLLITDGTDKLGFNIDSVNWLITLNGNVALSNSIYDHIAVTIPANGLPSDFKMLLNAVNDVASISITGTTADSGTTTSTSAFHLVQTGQNFNSTIMVGALVKNTTDNTYAFVTALNSDTDLTLSHDIMASGEAFTIYALTTLDSGTTNGATTAFHLIQSGQNFLTTVEIGDRVKNRTDNTFAIVTAVNSNTDLTLDTDIMATGELFTIYDGGKIDNSEAFGIGSQEGGASVACFEGSQELMTYIAGADMSADWVESHYNNISDMDAFIIAISSTTDNQFPTAWDTSTRNLVRSRGTYIDDNLTSYPSAIYEKQVNATFWLNVQNGGGNLRAARNKDGTNQIALDIVTCDTATKKLEVWFEVDITDGGGDKVYFFPKTTNGNDIYQPHWDNTNGRNEVYSPIQTRIWCHLAESATPGSTTAVDFYKDSSGTGNDGQGSFAPTQVTGIIGKGQQGNASNRRILIGDNGFPTGKNVCVMEAWCYYPGDSSEQTPFGYGNDANGQRRVIQQRGDGTGGHISNAMAGVANQYSGWTLTSWLFPVDAGTLNLLETRMFFNGVEALAGDAEPFKYKILSGTNLAVSTVLNQAQILRGTDGLYSDAPTDEVRLYLSLPANPTAWFKLNYYSQLDPRNLWQLVDDEENLRGNLKNFYGGFQ